MVPPEPTALAKPVVPATPATPDTPVTPAGRLTPGGTDPGAGRNNGPLSGNAVRLKSSGRRVRYRSTPTNSVDGSRSSRRATSASVATPRSVAYQVINARARDSRRCRDRDNTSLRSPPTVHDT